ncbi:MAG: DUF2306 domain-containing protein [Ramlibacter sp.]
MALTPLVAIHMTAALAALAVGPLALWARRAGRQRPRLHRAFGHAWVTLMLASALSAPSRFLGHMLWVDWLGIVPVPVRQAAVPGF